MLQHKVANLLLLTPHCKLAISDSESIDSAFRSLPPTSRYPSHPSPTHSHYHQIPYLTLPVCSDTPSRPSLFPSPTPPDTHLAHTPITPPDAPSPPTTLPTSSQRPRRCISTSLPSQKLHLPHPSTMSRYLS
ncbi:hypothetical protein QCA50_000970 [Cerrena zonata]|uniref:Uncharacterized protein n=1 Tax=Cerrena zonata TaxID=2478898 RepID=A0AAW0H0L1_9APHY